MTEKEAKEIIENFYFQRWFQSLDNESKAVVMLNIAIEKRIQEMTGRQYNFGKSPPKGAA
jgi:hypothetical protein